MPQKPLTLTTNLKLSREHHGRAKAAAALLNEEFYQFIEKAIDCRIEILKKEGKLKL